MREIPTFRLSSRVILALCLAAVLTATGAARLAAAGSEEGCLTSSINGERKVQGAKSLAPHSGLAAIARRHSARMAQEQRYYHNGNLRNELPPGWRSEGENVGWATDCAHMHNFFMNSPSHRKNILNPVFNQIGMGVVVDAQGKLWVTQVFVESSGQPGLSTESRATLNAPPPAPETAPGTDEAAQSPPDKDQKAAVAQAPAKPPAGPASTIRSATPSPTQAPLKKAKPPLQKQPPAQTLAYQDLLESEPGWPDSGTDTDPIVFDLELSL